VTVVGPSPTFFGPRRFGVESWSNRGRIGLGNLSLRSQEGGGSAAAATRLLPTARRAAQSKQVATRGPVRRFKRPNDPKWRSPRSASSDVSSCPTDTRFTARWRGKGSPPGPLTHSSRVASRSSVAKAGRAHREWLPAGTRRPHRRPRRMRQGLPDERDCRLRLARYRSVGRAEVTTRPARNRHYRVTVGALERQ
jgi:hypothetical protein